jgi:aspartyl/asparaginyl-tRNA synthetase
VRDLRDHLGQTVTVRGWVNALRLQRAIQFVIVRDFSGMVQVTSKRGGSDYVEEVIEALSEESAVEVTGRVVDNPIVNLGGLEIIPDRISVLGRAAAPLPIDEHSGPEHRLDWRFLDVRPDLTFGFDLLWRGLEITTGAQREHRYDVLTRQTAEKGMSIEPMAEYMNAFRYGCPPHGGLGMGLNRILMVLLGLESIRDATFLYRGPNRLTP